VTGDGYSKVIYDVSNHKTVETTHILVHGMAGNPSEA
jgi:hypothetical protein